MKNYFLNLLIMLDQMANTLLGGYPDETISLRTARERDINKKQWACIFCKMLDWFQQDHCTKVEANERASIRYRGLA